MKTIACLCALPVKVLAALGVAFIILIVALTVITWSWWQVGRQMDQDRDERGPLY